MARVTPPLAPDEVRALLEQTLAWLDAPHPEAEALPRDDWRQRVHLALSSLRFGVVAAAVSADPSLRGCLERAAAVLDGWIGDGRDVQETFGRAVEVATAHAPAGLLAERHASHEDPAVRANVADRLDARVPAQRATLERLAADGDPRVRAAARRALGPRETPWWEGKLSRDPMADLDPEEAARVAPALATLSSLLDLEAWQLQQQTAALEEALAAVPDGVVLDVATRMADAGERLAHTPAVLREALRRGGGWDAAARGFAGERRDAWKGALRAVLRAAGPSDGPALAAAAVGRAVAAQRGGDALVATGFAKAAAYGWQREWEGDRLLDALVEAGAVFEEHGEAGSALDFALGRARLTAAAAERVAGAFTDGFPGRWAPWRRGALAALAALPRPALRELVARLLADPREPLVVWAAARALGPAGDPALDPPPLAHRLQLLDLPAVRRAAFGEGELALRMLPAARVLLREGRLDLPEATHTLKLCGRVYGGTGPSLVDVLSLATLHSAGSARGAADAAGVTDPAWAPVGPPTAEEWAAYRELLRAADEPPERVYPAGPLPEEDRARARAFVDRALAGAEDMVIVVELAALAAGSDRPDDLDALEALVAREPLSRIRDRWLAPLLSAGRARLAGASA